MKRHCCACRRTIIELISRIPHRRCGAMSTEAELRAVSGTGQGFTLIELMVALAVAGIVLVVGLPGLKSLIQNNRLTTSTNHLVGSLYLARAEAVARNQPVSVCANDPVTGDWSRGWFVAVGEACSPDHVLRRDQGDHAELSSPVRQIVFLGDGTASATPGDSELAGPVFELVNAGYRREIYVEPSGHVHTRRGNRQESGQQGASQ